MSTQKLNPYLNFNGTAGKAIQLYEKALGAKAETLMRYGDVPGNKQPPEAKDRVMHARLRIGEGVVMISDAPPNMQIPQEGNVHILLDFSDVQDMTRKFNALAEGGRVTQPLEDTFWGARFGMLTDAYGIRWMFNCEHKKA